MRLLVLSIYAIGMAYVEAMVVVYLRMLIKYADLTKVSPNAVAGLLKEAKVYFPEQTREAATIVMIAAVALLAGRTTKEKIGAFLWCFGVWDIFYYVFLRLWLGWPKTIMDSDVLFLIPVPWVAPVILPVSISAVMMLVALWLFWSAKRP